MNIAIDGPAGSGKSTVAKRVADRLKLIYVDTGAMYRALTWKALQERLDVHNQNELIPLLDKIQIKLIPTDEGQNVELDGQNISSEIRQQDVTQCVSIIASHQKVREEMVHLQKEMAKNQGVVMDGRDIGTHVLPDADVKVFLSASLEERAKRRFQEQQIKGNKQSLADVQEEMNHRDEDDRTRQYSPLKQADDAVVIDTTSYSIDEVVSLILDEAHKKTKP